MNTKRLETFLAIVRCGSFAAASERLHMTQSAISLRIRELEDELRIALFDRSGRKATLTPAGRDLVPHAESIILAVDEMRHSFGKNRLIAECVRVGVAELIAVTWLPKLISTLQRDFPFLTLDIEIGAAREITDRVKRNLLDIALMPGTGVSIDNELETSPLGEVEFKWVASPNLVDESYSWTAPDAAPVLLLNNINQVADAWFRSRQIVPRRVNTCNSLNALAELAVHGLGVALLPTFHYEEELKNGQLKVVDADPRITVAFFAMYRNHGQCATSRLLAAMAQDASTFQLAD